MNTSWNAALKKKNGFIVFGSKENSTPNQPIPDSPSTSSGTAQSTNPNIPSTSSGNILWGTAAAAALGAYMATTTEERRRLAEEKRRREARGKRNNSDYMKMRRAEKAGRLDKYLREKNMSERERKHRKELQAIWDANGAAIYDAKKAAEEAVKKARKSALREKALGFKEKLLELRDLPKKKITTFLPTGWKEADIGAASAAVAAQEEVVEKKSWWERAKEKTQKVASSVSGTFGRILSPRKKTGAYKMASPVQDGPPSIWDKLKNGWNSFWGGVGDSITDIFSGNKKKQATPTATSTLDPTLSAVLTEVVGTEIAGLTQTAHPTSTPIPIVTPTTQPTATPTPNSSNIDGALSVEQIPPEFRCTLEEEKEFGGKMYTSDYYWMCKEGEYFIEKILTDQNGWWWKDGVSQDGISQWNAIQSTEDIWKLVLTISLDSEGSTVRRDDPNFAEPFATAMRNKFWHFDHGVKPSYQNRTEEYATPLGHNGRLTFLGSLDSVLTRNTHMRTGKVASETILPPYDYYITNNWNSAQKTINNIVWPEPDWMVPNKQEPYDWANAHLMMKARPSLTPTMTAILNAEIGVAYNQVYYMSPGENSIQILTTEQKEFFYAQNSK